MYAIRSYYDEHDRGAFRQQVGAPGGQHGDQQGAENGANYLPPDIIRYVKLVSGSPVFRVKYDPRLEYAEHPVKFSLHKKYIKTYTTKGDYDSLS